MKRATVKFMGRDYTIDNVDGLTRQEIADRVLSQHEAEETSRNIKGFGTAVGNGLTFNNGKRVWAALKTAMKHWGDNTLSDRQVKEIYGDRDKMNESANSDWETGKQEFQIENEQFKKEHPRWNTAGEIVGGIPTAFIPVGHIARGAGLGAKIAQGAYQGGVLGAAYGAGSGLNESSDLLSKEAALNALNGGGIGLVAGAGTGGALSGLSHIAGKGINSLKNMGRKGRLRKSFENIGDDSINQSIKTGRPLIEQENPHIAPEIQRAVLNSEDVATQFDALRADKLAKQRGVITDELLDKFGNRSAKEHADVIDLQAMSKVRPKYEALEKKGLIDISSGQDANVLKNKILEKTNLVNDLEAQASKDPNIAKLMENTPEYSTAGRNAIRQEIAAMESELAAGGNNIFQEPYVQKIVQEVKKLPRYRNLADNDAQVLIAVDKRLRDRAFNYNNANHLDSVGLDERAMINDMYGNFRKALDQKLPEYAQARQAHIDTKAIPTKAMEYGQKLKNLSDQQFRELQDMVASNPDALRSLEVGVGDTLKDKLFNAAHDDVSQYSRVYDDNTLRKLKDLRLNPSENIIGQRNALENIGKALGNSKTAHAQAQMEDIKIPKLSVKSLINKALGSATKESAQEAAQKLGLALTNTKKLAEFYKWAKMPKNSQRALKVLDALVKQGGRQGGHIGSMVGR